MPTLAPPATRPRQAERSTARLAPAPDRRKWSKTRRTRGWRNRGVTACGEPLTMTERSRDAPSTGARYVLVPGWSTPRERLREMSFDDESTAQRRKPFPVEALTRSWRVCAPCGRAIPIGGAESLDSRVGRGLLASCACHHPAPA